MKKVVNINIDTNVYTLKREDTDIICTRRDNDTIVYLLPCGRYERGRPYKIGKSASSQNSVYIYSDGRDTLNGKGFYELNDADINVQLTTDGKSWTLEEVKSGGGGGSEIIANLADGAMPIKSGDQLIDSGMYMGESGVITSRRDLELPPNTLHLGTNVKISENGGFVQYHTNSLDKEYIFLDYENDHKRGSSAPIYWKRGPLIEDVKIQPDDTYKMVDVTSFSVNSANNSEMSRLYFKIAERKNEKEQLPNNVRIRMIVNGSPVAHYPSKQAWDLPMLDEGWALEEGINTIDLVPHFSFLNAYGSITFEIRNDGPIEDYVPVNLMGSQDLGLPYMACDKNEITPIEFDMEAIEKQFGSNVRLSVKGPAVYFRQRVEHGEEPDTWDVFASVSEKSGMFRSIRIIDQPALENPLRTGIFVRRTDLIDNEGNVRNDMFDVPVFEMKALGGAFAPCIQMNGKPYTITEEGRLLELALVGGGSGGWDPKIVKYNDGDNITLERKEIIRAKSKELTFSKREEEKKSTIVSLKLPEGYLGNYDIIVTQESGSAGSRLFDLTMDTITTRTKLVMGRNENILIDDLELEVLIEATGKQWTDIASPWCDGVFKSLTFEFINKEKGIDLEMFVGDGVLNQALLPETLYVGKTFRIIESGLRLLIERKNENGTWIKISEFS